MKHAIALVLAGALIAAPVQAFVVVDGELGLDKREADMLKTVCAGEQPVCTFIHVLQVKAMADKAFADGKKAGLAQACKGVGV